MFPWILLEDYLNLGKVMTIYMLLWIGSAKCVFKYLVTNRLQLNKLQICSFSTYGFILDYPLPLYLIETPDFLGSFG